MAGLVALGAGFAHAARRIVGHAASARA